MAFDQATRNRLQSFVSKARTVLEEEFSQQMTQTYGLDPSTGKAADLSALTHLSDAQRETARILRETQLHYVASQSVDERGALDRILREQAFTVLNRLAALRMAEARGLLIDTISEGYDSRGFQLYKTLAGAGLGETGDAYRVYLFSVFDEFAQELPGLFDRYSPQGRLFPREVKLLELLGQINDTEIAHLWGEDETIGWIYQYFNSQEERKRMRAESQAPRNSRELAVRNQFFTPRYVVEFLVDNTLGKMWFNATGGQTFLKDRCQYLLVKPDESPEPASQLRDPRTLKLLDPACGSMHFGLYAFDLFLEIYREAWAHEQQLGAGSLDTKTQGLKNFQPLMHTYPSEEAYLLDVPRLVIEHNIYGVDIDPRAAQIASLALWLRAQRAWHEAGIKARQRPLIGRGNVVAAVAPPGEQDLILELAKDLDPNQAKSFVMLLENIINISELGILYDFEKDIVSIIQKLYNNQINLFNQKEHVTWRELESDLKLILADYRNEVEISYRERLFLDDLDGVFGFFEILNSEFDIVVMNPPFGEMSKSTKDYLEANYPLSKGNILTIFIERSTQILRPGGRIGAIISRTCLFLQSFSDFRTHILNSKLSLETMVDLGQGVLDAMVETAAITWQATTPSNNQSYFFRELNTTNKDVGLLDSLKQIRNQNISPRTFIRDTSDFTILPEASYVYWIPKSILLKINQSSRLGDSKCEIRVGLQTGDDFRFLRLWWEPRNESILSFADGIIHSQFDYIKKSDDKKWAWYSKSSSAIPITNSIHLCVNWLGNGREIRAFHVKNGDSESKYVRSESFYFQAGVSYMLRSSRIVPYLVPHGVIPTAGRSQVYINNENLTWVPILLASNLATAVARFSGEAFRQPKFQNSMISSIPFRKPSDILEKLSQNELNSLRQRTSLLFKSIENDIMFTIPKNSEFNFDRRRILSIDLDRQIADHFELTLEEFHTLEKDHDEALENTDLLELSSDLDSEDTNQSANNANAILTWSIGVAFGRFDWRLATGEREMPADPEPFDPLPAKSPGMLPDGATPFHAHQGILTDDPGHAHDLTRLIEGVLEKVEVPVPAHVQQWLRKDFFAEHLKQYSKSRRKAPIYWPLSTTSGSYTLWIYYPALTNQTLYSAVNDFVEPKLKQVQGDITALKDQGGNRSKAEEKQYENLLTLQKELLEFRDVLLGIAEKYQPNHDDGVQISAAPLWQLFRHKPWQKALNDTWTKLAKGDYDWAYLAMAYWPDRVRAKCQNDKSLAIAHNLEPLYTEPAAKGKKGQKTGENP